MTTTQPSRSQAQGLVKRPEIVGPPRERFLQHEWYQKELQAAFVPEWHLVAHSTELREPGNFVTFSLGTDEVVIVRTRRGELRSYRNFCPHRGHRLVTGSEEKVGRNFVCPYHGWSFEADTGACVYAPRMHDSFEAEQWPLVPATVEEAHGFVFVCLSDSPPPSIGQAMTEVGFGGYDMSRLKIAMRDTFQIRANWKQVVENNLECYHCALNHPELCTAYDPWSNYVDDESFDAGLSLSGELAHAGAVGAREVPNIRFTIGGVPTSKVQLPRMYGNPRDSYEMWWYPSYYIVLSPDLGHVQQTMPLDENTTLRTDLYLVHEDAVEGVDYNLAEITKFWKATYKEDVELAEEVHRGMQNPHYKPGPLNRHFQTGQMAFFDWLEERLALLDQTKGTS
jgi:phenylpropionate dioxygenase-like ring-hydroxylating dioxygenase large terminal subunit